MRLSPIEKPPSLLGKVLNALMLRPVPHSAQYASPVDGLFLCGAGSHPGGGVMGSAGRNAAHAVLGAMKVEDKNS